MEDAKIPLIKKLGQYNYVAWKRRMQSILVIRGVWGAVSDPDNADEDAIDKALAYIRLNVEEDYLTRLEETETAKEAWDLLESTFANKSSARKLQLRRELAGLRKESGEPVSKYVARAQELRLELAAAVHNVEDEELVWHILDGLPAAYVVRRDVKHVAQGLNRQMPRFSWCLVRVLLRSEKCFWPDA